MWRLLVLPAWYSTRFCFISKNLTISHVKVICWKNGSDHLKFFFHKGCCTKIRVYSTGKRTPTGITGADHYWAMGTFVKDEKLTEASLGTKTVYKIDNFEHLENSQQYYLEGSENDGWKVIFQIYVQILCITFIKRCCYLWRHIFLYVNFNSDWSKR